MRPRTALITLAAAAVLLQTAGARAQATNPPYLSQMPSMERVKAEVKGADAMDTAARQMGAFWQLQEIIKNLAGPRFYRNQLTPDEGRLIGQYRYGYSTAEQPYVHIQKSPSHPDKPKWYKLHAFYEQDEGFLDELLQQFFSPEFRAAYYRATGKQPPQSATSQPTTRLTAPPTAQPSAAAGRSAQAYLAEGRKYFSAKDFEKAVEPLKKAVALDPSLSDAHFMLGATYSALRRNQDALPFAKEAARLAPKDHTHHFSLGLIYFNLKQYENALSSLQQAVRLEPGYAESHYWLGRVHADGYKQYEKAISALREAIRLDPDNAYAYRDLGAVYSILKQYPQALEATRQALRLKPDHALAHLNHGRILFRMGRKDEAIQVYNRLLTLDKQKAQELYAETNKAPSPQPAATSGTAATPPAGGPGRPPGRRANARPAPPTNTRPGRPANAAPGAPAGGNADDYLAQGSKYIAAKEYAMAVEAFNKAISLKPSLWNAHFGLGRSYYYLDEFGKALEPLDEAARLKPAEALIHYFIGMNAANIADGLIDKNDKPSADDKLSALVFFGKAIEAFEEAIRLRPNESGFHSELGMVYWRMNDHQNAMKEYNAAIRLDPKNIGAHYYLGRTYIKQGKKNEALQIQKKLLTLNKEAAQKLYAEIDKMK